MDKFISNHMKVSRSGSQDTESSYHAQSLNSSAKVWRLNCLSLISSAFCLFPGWPMEIQVDTKGIRIDKHEVFTISQHIPKTHNVWPIKLSIRLRLRKELYVLNWHCSSLSGPAFAAFKLRISLKLFISISLSRSLLSFEPFLRNQFYYFI